MVEPSDKNETTEGDMEQGNLPEVLRELSSVIEKGKRIDTEEYLAKYPRLSPQLKEFFRTQGLPEGFSGPGLGPGEVLGDYRIVEEIGRGGMGMVYEAEQLSLNRIVALKVLPSNALSNARAIERFRREATAVARLSHPRIVAIHGFSTSGSNAYLAMELVRGLDMADVIDRLREARTHGRRFVIVSGPHMETDIAEWARGRKLVGTLPGDVQMNEGVVIDLRNYGYMAAAIAADAADALRHAHSQGIIHRDVKPSNLIMGQDGRIKLTDFGLAKGATDASLTKTGDFVGSPAYVSPEQASSRRSRIDERSDIYSLGVTLYESVTLHQPFAGKDVADVLRKIITKDPPPPSKVNPRIPKDLETIILKAIEKDPEKRFQSVEEFGNELRRFINYEPILVRPVGPIGKAFRSVRRHRAVWAGSVLGGAAVLLIAGAVFLSTGGFKSRTQVPVMLTDGAGGRTVNPTTTGVLELVQEWSEDLTPAERLDRIVSLSHDADELLLAGDLDKVGALLEQIDAKLGLSVIGADMRTTLDDTLSNGKSRFIAAVKRKLDDGGTTMMEQRQLLAPVERLLLDNRYQVCRAAAVMLGEVKHPASLYPLADALQKREDADGQVAIIKAIGKLGQEDGWQYLPNPNPRSIPDEHVRMEIMRTYVALWPDNVVDQLAVFAFDPQHFIVEYQENWSEAIRQTNGEVQDILGRIEEGLRTLAMLTAGQVDALIDGVEGDLRVLKDRNTHLGLPRMMRESDKQKITEGLGALKEASGQATGDGNGG